MRALKMLLPVLLALALVWAAAVHGPALARTDADSGRRLALIVGNSQYESVYSLKNAVNDAEAMAETLERLGFEVTVLRNARHEQFEATIDGFAKAAEGAEATVFFYAGHGFQLGGANYLVPSDAALKSREAIEKETLRLDSIISRLQARNRQTLIFLDACRNNPLPESVRGQNAADGLAQIETGSGTFVAFATQPGNITVDGQGDNSPFTLALLEHIDTPGISISDLMIRVRNSVEDKTLQQQTPWDQSSLRSQFYFNPEGEGSDALTDDDRELLMSLDPALRAKFAQRFGLRIESVDDEEADEPLIPVITAAVSIEPMSEEPVAPASEPIPPTAMLSITPADEPDVSSQPAIPDQVPLPANRPDPQQTPEREAEVEMAAVDRDAGRTRAPASVDPVRIPSASGRAPSTVTGVRPSPAEPAASPREAEVAALSTSQSATLRFSAPEFGTAGRVTEPDRTAADALDAFKRVPTQSGTAVSLNPVAGDHRRVLGQEVAPEVQQTEVAALQPAAEAAAEAATDGAIAPAATSASSAAPTLTPAPQESAPPAGPDTKLAALDPAEIRPDPVPLVPAPKEQADLPDDLPRAIQAELARLGCYRSAIDGIWGSGSARALLRYYATKKESPDDLEPNAQLYARLTAEEQVVCTHTEAAKPKPQATTPRRQRENATPVRQEPTARRQVPSPSASSQAKPTTPRRAEAAEDGSGKRTLRRTLGTGTFR